MTRPPVLLLVAAAACAAPKRVPRLWDDAELSTWATPVAGLGRPPTFASSAEYYAAPVDNLRTYPVYHPDHEPPGYRAFLLRQGPRPLIEPERLRTQADWIAAGERVFEELDAPDSRSADPRVLAHFSSAASIDAYRDAHHDVMTRDGILLDYRWVVDRDGKLKVSLSSCAGCHTRLMPDGTALRGAPANYDLAKSPATQLLLDGFRRILGLPLGAELYAAFGVPWLGDDAHARFRAMSDAGVEGFLAQETGEPPGTLFARFNGSLLYPTRMGDLRGIRHRRYLDATGTFANRGPADVARYGILVEYADLGRFGEHHMLPPRAERVRFRPADEAMYAMALYLWSLEPPASPHPVDERARRGAQVFAREGCAGCHEPPNYTSNELLPVEAVGTDPSLALRTRKGTGYYRVPTLRGLWYRGLFEHSGSVRSLEDWFDPRRLRDDYVPTGWRGFGVTHRAVPGHHFGLDLSEDDKTALIAFLLTL